MALISQDSRDERLQLLLDTTYAELRDQNFVSESSILVYDEDAGVISEVPVMELPLRFPISGKGARWSAEDLGKIIATKAMGYRQSMVAHSISDDDSQSTPACCTAVLWLTTSFRPYRRLRITANIQPGQ